MRLFALSLCLILFVLSTHCRSPSDFFSDSDAAALKTLVSSSRRNDGTFGSGLADTHYAVSITQRLNGEALNKEGICNYARQYLKGTESVENIYHAVMIVDGFLNCGEKVSADVVRTLESALESGRVTDTFYATAALYRLKHRGHAEFDEADIEAAVGKIVELQEDDGTFKNEQGDKRGSPFYAGLAFQVIAAVKSDAHEAQISSIVDNIAELLSLAEEDGVIIFSEVNALDNLKATASVLNGINALAIAGHPVSIDQNQIVGFAEYFIRHKRPTTLQDAFFLLNGIETVANNKLGSPLVLTLPRRSILSSSKRSDSSIQARITDIKGRFATAARVYLTKVYPAANEGNILLRNQEGLVDETDGSLYSFNFLATKPEPGYYHLEFSVTPADTKRYFPIDDAIRTVKVVAAIEISDAELRITDSKDEEDNYASTSITYPGSAQEIFTVNLLQRILLSFKVKNQASGKAVQPHQVFVRFTHEKSGHETTFVAKQQANKKYKLSLEIRNHLAAFKASSGAYSVDVVIGDPFIQNPILWRVATVILDFGTLEEEFKGSSRATPQGPRPEISHQFRAAEVRPREIFSLTGTALALAPILILLVGLVRSGANLKRFPSGAGALSAFLFHISIAGILGLFALFWLSLNLVQTLQILFVLSLPAFFFGLSTLKRVHKSRVAEAHTD